MISRENRAILVGMGSAVVVAAVSGGGAITYVAVTPGLALLAPQLYLAHTTTGPTEARRHRRVGLGLSGLLVLSLASNLPRHWTSSSAHSAVSSRWTSPSPRHARGTAR